MLACYGYDMMRVRRFRVVCMAVVDPTVLMADLLHEADPHRMVVMGHGHHQQHADDGHSQ